MSGGCPPLIPPDQLRWHPCRRQAGHGVASGRAADSPYPAGTIALQRPLFARHGLDLGECFEGTLNVVVPGGEWRLHRPLYRFEQLQWTPLHPPETFSFWPALLRGAACCQRPVAGWIYWPHPETKQRHHQPPGQLELLMPWLANLAELESGTGGLELGVDGRHCRLIQPAPLKARLLEFLKFRVLAAQDDFFQAFEPGPGATSLRAWLAASGWRQALDLSDADLQAVLATARRLYLN